jgi:hypothetical protein
VRGIRTTEEGNRTHAGATAVGLEKVYTRLADIAGEPKHDEEQFRELVLRAFGATPDNTEHVAALTTDHADSENFLTFVQPPQVEVGYRKLKGLLYIFDSSETIVMNSGAKIIKVQRDFNRNGKLNSTQGYSFVQTAKKEPALQLQYELPSLGKYRVASNVQDDAGGEGLWVGEVEAE